jgi:hypothetical protein
MTLMTSQPNFLFRHDKQIVTSTLCYLLRAGILVGLLFDLKDGGDVFLRNVVWLSTDYTA